MLDHCQGCTAKQRVSCRVSTQGQGNKENLGLQSSDKVPAAGVCLDEVRKSLNCGLCNGLLASSLVLSCGHIFCGHCLFEWVSKKPSCPTCQVGLRAIPVRCLALDSVAAAYQRFLPKSEMESFQARGEDGKSAANKLNKMFWWLQPASLAAGDPYSLPTAPQAATTATHNLPTLSVGYPWELKQGRSHSFTSMGSQRQATPCPPQPHPYAIPPAHPQSYHSRNSSGGSSHRNLDSPSMGAANMHHATQLQPSMLQSMQLNPYAAVDYHASGNPGMQQLAATTQLHSYTAQAQLQHMMQHMYFQ